MNDEGIRQIGRNKFQVRVKRINAKTGKRSSSASVIAGTIRTATNSPMRAIRSSMEVGRRSGAFVAADRDFYSWT